MSLTTQVPTSPSPSTIHPTPPAATGATDPRWLTFLDVLDAGDDAPAERPATHVLKLALRVDLKMVIPPWVDPAEVIKAVLIHVKRLDADDVLNTAGMDHDAAQALPDASRVVSATGSFFTV